MKDYERITSGYFDCSHCKRRLYERRHKMKQMVRKLFCRHKSLCVMATFIMNNRRMVVLQCSRCNKYQIMSLRMLRELQHNEIITVFYGTMQYGKLEYTKEEINGLS